MFLMSLYLDIHHEGNYICDLHVHVCTLFIHSLFLILSISLLLLHCQLLLTATYSVIAVLLLASVCVWRCQSFMCVELSVFMIRIELYKLQFPAYMHAVVGSTSYHYSLFVSISLPLSLSLLLLVNRSNIIINNKKVNNYNKLQIYESV